MSADWRTDPTLLGIELRLVAEAQSAVGQCCLALGDDRTKRIRTELSGVEQELRDHLGALNGPLGSFHG